MKNGDGHTEEFIAAARRYCQWAESEPTDPQTELKRARELLVELYLKVLQLPDVRPGDVEVPQLLESEILPVYRRMAKLPAGIYWECFNPFINPAEEPVAGSLSDDRGDIYRDMKHGFRCLESGYKVEAVWQWNFSFRSHWGRHLVSALRAMHCYVEDNYFK
jgi:hypothetical protein